MITLVLGGARSGKSAVAERLVSQFPGPVTYVATASVDRSDPDHVDRIERHRARRDPAWGTVEADTDLAHVLATASGTVLVDSLGTWVTRWADLAVEVEPLVRALLRRAGDTVLVSEEVGLGVHPATELGRRFRDVMGTVNTTVAAASDRVLLVVAGRVLALEEG